MKTATGTLFGLIISAGLYAQPSTAPVTSAVKDLKAPVQPLSSATLNQIARMPLLFDGKTLDGWIQAPAAPIAFSANDIAEPLTFARKLLENSDPLSRFIGDQFDAAGHAALAVNPSSAANAKEMTSALVKNLNRLVGGELLYDETRFQGIRLRSATEVLRQKKPQGLELMRLNRMLLEDAYPAELVTSPTVAWMVKGGTIASTGAGRGVIYTKSDYAHYRIILTVRHVTGKPDHKPGILVFCTRPAEGEKGLDALGGIQFQVPTGSHWDYRLGHNDSGSAFTNPVKTTFDYHQWHQVEILVNAKDGTARMAVAQPVGTRAIENADFSDPTAGKSGPIALQMHNSGLFDEYKDVRIEVDPTEDRLITVE